MTKRIPLSGKYGQGKFATVDDADYAKVEGYSWHVLSSGYAATSTNDKSITMHRLILEATPGQEVDHIDGNPLNNSRVNLRFATSSQQKMNTRKQKRPTSSVFKGVSLKYNRWQARIKIGDNYLSLGRYLTQREAAAAYNNAAVEHFGEFASLNDLSLLSDSSDIPLSEHVPVSTYKGVYRRRRQWRAYIDVDRQRIWLGSYSTEEAAARAYDAYVKEHNLDRPLNLPDC